MAQPPPTPQPTKCRLLTLPAELRNRIWSATLSTPHKTTETDTALGVTAQAVTRRFQPPNILRVCRQIRSEALPMYYTPTTFAFGVGPQSFVTYGRWLTANREHAEYLRHVRLYGKLHGWVGWTEWYEEPFKIDIEIEENGVPRVRAHTPLECFAEFAVKAETIFAATEEFLTSRAWTNSGEPWSAEGWSQLLGMVHARQESINDDSTTW